MCGIAGFSDPGLDPSAADERLQPMLAAIRHRGPDDEGSGRAGRRPRHASAQHHRPRRRASADPQRGPHGLGRLQRRDLQLPRAARRARAPRATVSTPSDTETIVHAYEEWGDGRRSSGCAACSRSRSGIDAPRPSSSRATGSAIKPLYYAGRRRAAVLRLRDQGAARAAGVDATLDSGALEHYLTFLLRARAMRRSSRASQAAAGTPPALADGRGAVRPLLAAASRGASSLGGPRRKRPRRCAPRPAGRRALAPGQRRAARRLPVGRHRLERGRRPDGGGVEPAGQDVLDRLRRATASTSSSTRAASPTHFGTEHHEFVVEPDAIGDPRRR